MSIFTLDAGDDRYKQRLLVATATRGVVRMEWVAARYNQIIPTNWSKTDMTQYMNGYIPIRYTVHDAQNLAVKECLDKGFEWLILLEDDTAPPSDAFLRFTEYMDEGKYPVVSGLYFTRSVPPEPMTYRGRGNHYFSEWKLGDRVWCDGVPTGMLLLHAGLLRAISDDSPEYMLPTGQTVKRVFSTLAQSWFNEETGAQETLVGTSDLDFCTRVKNGGYLNAYPAVAKRKYPFLVDTNIFCRHYDLDGTSFPIEMPAEFIPPEGYVGKERK